MACRFHSPTIVGWMPCLVANCAVVSSPRSASSATFALKSAEYRFRLLVIQVRPSQERTELKLSCLPLFLSFFFGPQAPTSSCVNIRELEQPIGHGRGAHGGPGQARQHRSEVVAPVEAVFEFRQITRHVL